MISIASNTKEEKTKQKSEKLSELAKTRAAQQANMLSQAADMARGEGDMQEAKKLYEKSVRVVFHSSQRSYFCTRLG